MTDKEHKRAVRNDESHRDAHPPVIKVDTAYYLICRRSIWELDMTHFNLTFGYSWCDQNSCTLGTSVAKILLLPGIG
jgi:hypothetical protein